MSETEERKQDCPEPGKGCVVKDIASPDAKEVSIKRDTKTPGRIFNVLNYFGFGFIANSTLSIFISYNALPTKPAQKMIGTLTHAAEPIVEGVQRLKQSVGWSKASELSKEVQKRHLTESARSATEVFCMFIAGCAVLLPMKWMEDHKKGIVDKIDRKVNRDYHKYCDQQKQEPESIIKEKPPTWGKLLKARAMGMAALLGIDAGIQSFNNARTDKGLPNLDTMEWKLGGKLHDAMPKNWRENFVNFFSRRKKGIQSIQPDVRKELAKAVGKEDLSRMVVAEQARLLQKEVSLTLIMAGLVYIFTKWGGLFKGKNTEETNLLEAAVTPMPITLATEDERHTERHMPRPRKELEQPESLHTAKLSANTDQLAHSL